MSLAKTNKYLSTAQQRNVAIQRNARASSIFEGATAKALDAASGMWRGKRETHRASSKASTKKSANKS